MTQADTEGERICEPQIHDTSAADGEENPGQKQDFKALKDGVENLDLNEQKKKDTAYEEDEEEDEDEEAVATRDEEASSSSTSSSACDDSDEAEQKRWALLEAIRDSAFCLLAQGHYAKNGQANEGGWKVERRTHGSFNYVVILSNGVRKLVVRIPANGSRKYWDSRHAFILRSEAHTLIYVKHKLPHFPCAEILGKDEGFENAIGAPYLLMSFLPGLSARAVWWQSVGEAEQEEGDEEEEEENDHHHDDDEENENEDGTKNCEGRCVCRCGCGCGDNKESEEDIDPCAIIQHCEENDVSAEKELLRITFLKSLAKTMAELRHLQFANTGMLYLRDPTDPESVYVGPHHHFVEPWGTHRQYDEYKAYWYSAWYYGDKHKRFSGENQGREYMCRTLLRSEPFVRSKKRPSDGKESFVLTPWDLDLQNILVNETGEVTAILDWDVATVVPHCVGFTRVPVFLQEDWHRSYSVPDNATLFPWSLAKYRKVYAEAMKDACADEEDEKGEQARYCEKSALYVAVQNLMYGDFSGTFDDQEKALMQKLMLEIPGLRSSDYEKFAQSLEIEEFRELWVPRWDRWVARLLDPYVV